MVVVPAETPDITPLVEPAVATDGLLLVQVPEPNASARVTVAPEQIGIAPVMGAGIVLTVNVAVAEQPANV